MIAYAYSSYVSQCICLFPSLLFYCLCLFFPSCLSLHISTLFSSIAHIFLFYSLISHCICILSSLVFNYTCLLFFSCLIAYTYLFFSSLRSSYHFFSSHLSLHLITFCSSLWSSCLYFSSILSFTFVYSFLFFDQICLSFLFSCLSLHMLSSLYCLCILFLFPCISLYKLTLLSLIAYACLVFVCLWLYVLILFSLIAYVYSTPLVTHCINLLPSLLLYEKKRLLYSHPLDAYAPLLSSIVLYSTLLIVA